MDNCDHALLYGAFCGTWSSLQKGGSAVSYFVASTAELFTQLCLTIYKAYLTCAAHFHLLQTIQYIPPPSKIYGLRL